MEHGATEAIMIMAALTVVPTVGTYLMRLWGPRWSLMLMPVVMLATICALSPTAYPTGYLEKGLTTQFQEAAGPIKEMFKAICSYSGFLKGITGTFSQHFRHCRLCWWSMLHIHEAHECHEEMEWTGVWSSLQRNHSNVYCYSAIHHELQGTTL